MNDLTILYYTANIIEDECAKKVRNHLLQTTKNSFPIISVSQKPLDFGNNLYIGKIGVSPYNCYKQIYEGLKHVLTEYVVCCEDDTIYNVEHFTHRPLNNVIIYNSNLWQMHHKLFWRKDDVDSVNTGMCCCIAPTKLLLRNLEKKFKKYPVELLPGNFRWQKKRWQEPGRTERVFGMRSIKVEYFKTKDPVVVFNRMGSLSGRQCRNGVQRIEKDSLEPYGNAHDLWNFFWK